MVRGAGGVGRGASARRNVVAIVSAVVIGATLVACKPAVPGNRPARNGLTSQTAAPSCWSIKQYYPSSPDGTYWLWTPKLVAPQQFYCDMTTDGGGWVLIGRGRDGWLFNYWGQRQASAVRDPITGPAAFPTAALSGRIVDGLLNGGRMDQLNDGIRLRRARDTAGTSWQEVVMRVKPNTIGPWTWAFGGGVYLSAISFDGVKTNFGFSNYHTNTTGDVALDDGFRRVFTYRWDQHAYRAGFSYGAAVVGQNNATSYLWQNANENSAIPFTQVFIRPIIFDADVVGGAHAPDGGLPATTVRKMLDPLPIDQPWGVTGLDSGTAVPARKVYVESVAQIGQAVYIGGKFLSVQHGFGGPTSPQPFLAAFDVSTGEWIQSFRPVIDNPVWEVVAAPDGSKLFVSGEFTNVNGQPNTSGVAALDPATGAPVSGWVANASRPTGDFDVRTMDVQGPWLYLGGNFTRISGGVGGQFVGPIAVGRLARVRLSDGRPDTTWTPALNTSPWGMDASEQGDRVYAVGAFTELNGVPLSPGHLAIVDTATGAAVPGLQPWQPSDPATGEASNAVLEVGDKVYQGGSQHYLHQYARSDYAFERAQFTKTQGGDYQAIVVKDGVVYGACHCTDWQYQDSNVWPVPEHYTKVNNIDLIGAYDQNDDLEQLPEFDPDRTRVRGAAGPWALFLDSRGCMWAAGDLRRPGASAENFYGGWEVFCDRDATAPATPPNATASIVDTTATITWDPATDDRGRPVSYEVLKDDPFFGTIVVGTTFGSSFTDTVPAGTSARYFVRTVDSEENRSASTPVLAVDGPPA